MPGKKGLMIAIPLVLVIGGGGFYGAAVTGLLKVPGITPKSKLGAKNLYGEAGAKLYGEQKDPVVAKETPSAPVVPVRNAHLPKIEPIVQTDEAKGAEAIAEIWGSIESPKLVLIAGDWTDEDLAKVFANLEVDKAAEVLSLLDPKRASTISALIQEQASVVMAKN